jgi:protein-tyrosine phosphatase
VHPERNQEIIADPNILLSYIEKGALAQLTASSYVGVFGKELAELSSRLIEANLVHILASDAHNIRGRAFHMKEAFAKLEKEFGAEKVSIFKQNAKDLLNGDTVRTPPPSEVHKPRKKFGLFNWRR